MPTGPSSSWESTLATLEEKVNYRFSDRLLLERALTRLAFAREGSLAPWFHMDALATLGDAVIDVVVIEALIAEGVHDKGIVTNRKTNRVNMTQLRLLAEDLDLAVFVRWGKGEKAQAVWTSGRVLAECMEALIGAVYLDAGIGAVRDVLVTIGFIEKPDYGESSVNSG